MSMLVWWVSRASCQTRKITGYACAGNAGNVFPVTAGPRSRYASQHVRDTRAVMHAGIVVHVGIGFLWNRWRGKRSGIPGACATLNFTHLVRSPLELLSCCAVSKSNRCNIFEDRAPLVSSIGERFSNELQRLDHMRGCIDSSPSNGRQIAYPISHLRRLIYEFLPDQ